MWSKYITRRLAVQVAQAWNAGWGEAMENVYGLSVRDTLVFRDGRKTEYYVDRDEHERYVAGLYALLEKPDFLRSFHAEARKTLESILGAAVERFASGCAHWTDMALLDCYDAFVLPNQTRFYVRMWTVFNIGEPLARTVEEGLRHLGLDDASVRRFLLIFSTPLEPNDVLDERMALLRIASDVPRLSERELAARLEEHTARFRHIPLFDFDHEPYAVEHFSEALRDIRDPKQELEMLERRFVQHRREYEEALEAIKPDAPFRALLRFLKENVFLRDYRDMIRQKLNLALRDFYRETGSRLGLAIGEVAALTDDEVRDYLRSRRPFPPEETARRKEAYLLIQRGDAARLFSGPDARAEAGRELLPEPVSVSPGMVAGTVGSPGKAIGTARIVLTNLDLAKVGPGDILVAAMTRQDFVPAMRKAVAVVTDEGSVTAHAAIIARELSIPCIVAARQATRTFKDGDLIEVDAERGVVRLLEGA